MRVDSRFAEGVGLFNKGDYFDCHEVIEALWLETASEDKYRDLYKGVIQAAAAVYQFDREILTGARGLYRSSVSYLEAYRPRALGLNVDRLIEELKRCFKDLESWDGKSRMMRDRSKTPTMELNIA